MGTKGRKKWFVGGAAILLALLIVAALYFVNSGERGVEDYQIAERQFTEVDTEQYSYWDTVTLGYVELEGLEEEVQAKINQAIYESVFHRANYWHYKPNEEVKAFQEEYSIYADDVICEADYYSQYLVSLNFMEYYAPNDPVYWVKFTQWGMNFDLLTGEEYELGDILVIDENFAIFWLNEVFEGEEWEEEYLTYTMEWFSGTSAAEEYEIVPYFYLTAEGDFVIGASMNPTYAGLVPGEPENNTLSIQVSYEKLKEFAADSLFWERYERSEPAGTVVKNEAYKENKWLGKEGSVWTYWETR